MGCFKLDQLCFNDLFLVGKLCLCFHGGVPAEQTSAAAPVQANGTTGWELALVTAPSSNDSATAASKMVLLLPFSLLYEPLKLCAILHDCCILQCNCFVQDYRRVC